MSIVTLSSEGVVHNPIKEINKLIEYYVSSNSSQTEVYVGMISSLKYILQKNLGDNLNTEITEDMEKYLSNHYTTREKMTVNVSVNKPENNIKITVTVEHNNISYTVKRNIVENLNI